MRRDSEPTSTRRSRTRAPSATSITRSTTSGDAIAGDVGEAVRWLRESAHNGNPCAAMIERDPLLASIRDSDDLRPLLAELHEQQERYAIVYRDAMTRPLTESQP